MAYLWGDPRMGLRTSNLENIPTYCGRQQLLQKSLVHLVSLDVFSSVFVWYLGVSDTGMDLLYVSHYCHFRMKTRKK